MRTRNLPALNPRYWTGIALASVFGTNMGDFVSQVLHLGHLRGLPPLAALLVAVLLAERRSRRASEAFYWIAIVVIRTSATNFADLSTHDLGLGYLPVVASLSVLMALFLLRPRDEPRHSGETADATRLSADGRYWITMLVAGIIGTSLGDLVDDGLGLGTATGSLILGSVLALALLLRRRLPVTIGFWLAIVAARTAGTAIGDFLAGEGGLPLSTALTGLAFAGTLMLWRPAADRGRDMDRAARRHPPPRTQSV